MLNSPQSSPAKDPFQCTAYSLHIFARARWRTSGHAWGNPPCTPDATSPTQKGRVDDWYIAAKIYGESIDRYKGNKTSYAESARQQSLAWERLKLAFED